jgi:DNA repair exonuclease SbcCD ATPase subunit
MSKKIEDFIRGNKAAFDTEVPGDHLWSKMEQRLNSAAEALNKADAALNETDVPLKEMERLNKVRHLKKGEQQFNKAAQRQPKSWWWIGIAASLLVVLGIGYMYNQKVQPGNALAQVNPQQAKKQVRFSSMIAQKADSLEVYAAENPELYQKFASDLERIQADYDLLKKDLVKSPNQEFVIRAMEKNLELQLQVVSQQLQIINQVRQVNKDSQL